MNQISTSQNHNKVIWWCCATCVTCLIAVALICHSVAVDRKRHDFNQQVKSNAQADLAMALSQWSTTVSPANQMMPDVVWKGENSRIVAIFTDCTGLDCLKLNSTSSDSEIWTVVAKTKAGNYFSVSYALCDSCDPDPEDAGWHRLYVNDFSELRPEDVKALLYQNHRRAEYRKEFGVEPPPEKVEG